MSTNTNESKNKAYTGQRLIACIDIDTATGIQQHRMDRTMYKFEMYGPKRISTPQVQLTTARKRAEDQLRPAHDKQIKS